MSCPSIDLFSRCTAISRTWSKEHRNESSAFFECILSPLSQSYETDYQLALIVRTVHESAPNGYLWVSNVPEDPRIMKRGKCSSGYGRCQCGINHISCTFYCQCKADACTNQSTIHVGHLSWTSFFSLEYLSPIDATNLGEFPTIFVRWPVDGFYVQ